MKYLLVVFSVLFLVACGGGNRQTLPPELQGGPLQPVSPQNEVDPLSSLPFDSLEEAPVIEIEAEVEAQVDDEVVEELPGVSVSAANCSAITQDLETSFSDINFCDICIFICNIIY
jgi:hypothetical protein